METSVRIWNSYRIPDYLYAIQSNCFQVMIRIKDHPWLTEIPAPHRGPGSDITNEGVKLQTMGGQ